MGEGDEETTGGAANFDNFKMYYSQIVIFAVSMAYVFPIFGKLLDDEPLEWRSKLKSGWNYICDRGGRAIEIKKPE